MVSALILNLVINVLACQILKARIVKKVINLYLYTDTCKFAFTHIIQWISYLLNCKLHSYPNLVTEIVGRITTCKAETATVFWNKTLAGRLAYANCPPGSTGKTDSLHPY